MMSKFLNAILDFLVGKPKEKTKPEPICYLFIGENQCIGGYETIALAFIACQFQETVDCFIASDMQGEDVLYRWQEKREYLLCGCEYKSVGWHNGQHFISPYNQQRTNYCGNDDLHNPKSIPLAYTGYHYMPSGGWIDGGITFRGQSGAQRILTGSGSGWAKLVDHNGDPLQ